MKRRIISIAAALTLGVNAIFSCGFVIPERVEGLSFIPRENMQDITNLKGAYPMQEYYSSAELGYVSGVDDQKSTEICWAFTQNNLIESYLLRNTEHTFDFSEQTMKFETSSAYNKQYGHERDINGGGNEYISIAYLARGGATLESDEVFTESEKRSVLPEKLEYKGVLTSAPVLHFDGQYRELAITHIKKLVYDMGAVGTGVYYARNSAFEDANRTNYYYNGNAGNPNHAVTIVGWDDNYSADNFKVRPEGDGAFIVQNSWGAYHDGGTSDLVYISYYDKFICSDVFATSFEMENDIYDNVYQYDHQGYTGKYAFGSDSSIMYATKYKKSSPGESISAVSTFVTDPGVKIEVLVNTQSGEMTDSSKFKKVYEKTFDYAGYYLMEFEKERITGDYFAVAIRITNPSGRACFPVRENLGNFVENAVLSKNACFVSGDGFESLRALESFPRTATTSFEDRKSMLVMKAFTVDVPFEIVDSTKLFTDVKAKDWFKSYVDFAVTYDIFNGTSDKTFSPGGSMTRAQFVQVLANISRVDTSDSSVESGFYDVPKGKWYTAAVTWAASKGIVSGVGNGDFAPDKSITRE